MYAGKLGLPELFVAVFMLAIIIVSYVKIFQKAGHSGWLVFCMAIPFVNVLFFLWFAFSEWPIEVELKRLRGMQGQNAPQV